MHALSPLPASGGRKKASYNSGKLGTFICGLPGITHSQGGGGQEEVPGFRARGKAQRLHVAGRTTQPHNLQFTPSLSTRKEILRLQLDVLGYLCTAALSVRSIEEEGRDWA